MNVEIIREVTLRSVVMNVDRSGELVLATLCREYSAKNVTVSMVNNKVRIGKDAYRMTVQIDDAHADEFMTTLLAQINTRRAA
jgi:hypothetical protein